MPPARLARSSTGGWRHVRAADGTSLAWTVDGPDDPGPGSTRTPDLPRAPAVVLCNGIACSDDYWADVHPALRRQHRVLRWDYRGHGRSALPADPSAVDVPALVGDLAAVLDAAGVSTAVLVGHSFGVQICLEAALTLAGRVAAVVAVAGAPGTPLRARPGRAERALERAAGLVARRPGAVQAGWRALWGTPAVYWAGRALRGTSREAARATLDAYFRHVAERDLATLVAMFQAMQAHSTVDRLPQLDVPVVAIAGSSDGLTPLRVMRALALQAPLGELVVVRGATHTLPAEVPGVVVAEVERLTRRLAAAEPAA